MSYEAVKWALYEAPMLHTAAGKPDTTARFVLVAHAERTDKHGKGSYPGPAALIAATGYDERTIDRAERRLQAAGLLVYRGISQLGTAKWDVDMSKRAADAEHGQADDRVTRRRAQDAARQRSRRERLKAAQNAAEPATDKADAIEQRQYESEAVTDAEYVTQAPAEGASIDSPRSSGEGVTDAEYVTSRILRPDVTDSASGCHGRSAPQTTHEPPMNHPGTIPGGTLPPDPLRPPVPKTGGPGTVSGSSLLTEEQQPPQPETVTYDRAREMESEPVPNLRLVEGNPHAPRTGTGPGSLFPAVLPAPPRNPLRRTSRAAEAIAEAMARREAARAANRNRPTG